MANLIKYEKEITVKSDIDRIAMLIMASGKSSKPERKYADSYKAQSAVGLVGAAVRKGTITRPEYCSLCQRPCKPEGHHEDYDKPLDVTWLCFKCHRDRHSELREAANELD